jgi:hypothetical protein
MPNTPPTIRGSSLSYVPHESPWTRTLSFIPQPFAGALQTGWTLTSGFPFLKGPASLIAQNVEIPDACIHDLAALTSVTMTFSPNSGHTGIPATMPSISVQRIALATLDSPPLNSAGFVSIPTPGSVGAWNTPNQTFVYTSNQNNVIDKTQYKYIIEIIDENGANALSGGLYTGFQLTYTLDSTAISGAGFGALWFP